MVRKISFAFIVISCLIVVNACSTFVPVPIELTQQAQETARIETEIAGKVYLALTIDALETLVVELSETPVPPTETLTLSPTRLPTSTDTPAPTSTDTPMPTSTETPMPTSTDTPMPTSTDTPMPTSTDTPMPTSTDTPAPTSTDTPAPTSTDTPMPTVRPRRTVTRGFEPAPSLTRPVPEALPTIPIAWTEAAPSVTEEALFAAQMTAAAIALEESRVLTSDWQPDFGDAGAEATPPAAVGVEPLPTLAEPDVVELGLSDDKILITAANPDAVYRIETEADEMILIRALTGPALELSLTEKRSGADPALIYLDDTAALIQSQTGGTVELRALSEGGVEIARIDKIHLGKETPELSLRPDPGYHVFIVQIPVGDGVSFEVVFDEKSGGEVAFIPWTGERPERYSGLSHVNWTSCCGLSEIYFVLLESGDFSASLSADWIPRDGGN